MQKRFVPLTADASPTKNPYEIRTYLGENIRSPEWKIELCQHDRRCQKQKKVNSTISKVLTLEDELRRLQQKAKESRFRRPFKKQCEKYDDYNLCVIPQRTIKEMKTHAIMREKYLQATVDLKARVHEGNTPDISNMPSLVQLNSPTFLRDDQEPKYAYQQHKMKRNMVDEEEGEEEVEEEAEGEQEELQSNKKEEVRPKRATPACSLDTIFMPSQKLLELKRPKSGMFVNQSAAPTVEPSEIPYATYNPRELQQQFDDQKLKKIDLIQGESGLWTWNLGLQKRGSELDNEFMKTISPELDSTNMELQLYDIPKDLQLTFNAFIVFGNEALIPEESKTKRSFYNRPKEIACIYVAYVESYRMSPDFWRAPTMDAILAAGEKLVKKSAILNYKSHDNDFDIIPQITEKQATIGLKIHYTGPLKEEPNIFKALSLYFAKYNAALLCSQKLYLLIWKRCHDTFFIYDPNGRNAQCQRNFTEGRSSLMIITHVEHLVHLIVNFSDANPNFDYNLYEIFLVNYGKISNPIASKPYPKRTRKLWAVVNPTYAIIPAANNGLQQPHTGNESNPSLITALLGLLYAGIETPSQWRMEVIDDLIKFGQNYYKAFVKKIQLKKKQQLNITDVHDKLVMGQFHASIQKGPFLFTGHVVNCKSFRDSQLTFAMKELFSSRWDAALVQIDNSTLAIWRDQDYFYVFDSFKRGLAGQVLDPEDYLTKGVACLQMHTSLESLCRILYGKAIKMRRGGKFFMHGIRITKIKPNATPVKNRYKRLQLGYPVIKTEVEKMPKLEKRERRERKDGKKGKKRSRLERSYSIQTVPDTDRIPEFDNADVTDGVMEEILCTIFSKLPEGKVKPPALYKCAEKVLLKSDKSYLQRLQYDLQHGEDFDNIQSAFRSQPEPPSRVMSLEEELLIPSNFQSLPDGAWIIFSGAHMAVPDEETAKLFGLLSCLITAALTSKYKISTWNMELVDFAMEGANQIADKFGDYEKVLEMTLSKKLPKIKIGQTLYGYTVQKVLRSTMVRSLRQVLLESLIDYNRLLVICQRFCCLIVKRYNFLYMFIGYPCNEIGVRKSSGRACLLRFVELDALLRRIEFGCNPVGNPVVSYVVVALKLRDVTSDPPERFKKWSEEDQNEMYEAELRREEELTKRKLDKMRFLDNELRRENERIQKFLTLKQRKLLERQRAREYNRQKKHLVGKQSDIDNRYNVVEDTEELVEYEGEEVSERTQEGEGVEDIPLKHHPGKKMARMKQDVFKPQLILYGYRLREPDCRFKIQGTKGLEHRDVASLDNIKTCFFASTLAILYAILRPLNQWNSQRIDRIIENALSIASKVTNMTTAFERIIKHVTVDDYEFDIWAKIYDVRGARDADPDKKIMRATQKRKYLLLQTPNTTFAIYRDDFFHLFDPYNTLETLEAEELRDDELEEEVELGEEETEKAAAKKRSKQVEEVKRKCLERFELFPDENHASWVLFQDADAMVRYIDARVSPDYPWKEQNMYTMHVVDVISYKKASPESRILQLLTDLSVPMESRPSQEYEDDAKVCAHAETMNWLDLENCLPVWSRMNRRNTAGRYRDMPVTKLRKYDIEIDGRLWSLWGTLHPQAIVFDSTVRGKQYLACNVIACCAASVYHLMDWSSQLLDSIIVNGDRYHRQSIANIKRSDYEFSIEDLNIECSLANIKFVVHIEHVVYGYLYCEPTRERMNLAEALMYFFQFYQFGVIQCNRRSLAIGRTRGFDGGYFMYDCQSKEHPLFPKGQGAAYLLRTKNLQVLLYCIVVTMNIPYYNMQFTIHKVEIMREGEQWEEGEEEEEDQGIRR